MKGEDNTKKVILQT